jgi:hypothetical protein
MPRLATCCQALQRSFGEVFERWHGICVSYLPIREAQPTLTITDKAQNKAPDCSYSIRGFAVVFQIAQPLSHSKFSGKDDFGR